MLGDDLEGQGGKGREAQRGGKVCIATAELFCCTLYSRN